MRIVDLIRKKRDGQELSCEEIALLIRRYVAGEVPDYQMAAFLMAVVFRGMTMVETQSLTRSMLETGKVVDLSFLPAPKVDKHSTGGVGDKVSLVVAPLAAAAGVVVPMMSGRGLGHTGGTLDKLESIPGFRVRCTEQEFKRALERNGLAFIGQTEDLVPADQKLYALRDVTATVESIPLIVGSIVSKKVAEGIDALLLDVKVGTGAFMKTEVLAESLARALVETSKALGMKSVALLTDMNQPLGHAVGNAVEVEEALRVLGGDGPEDLRLLCVEMASHMLVLAGTVKDLPEGRGRITDCLRSGAGLEKLEQVIEFQGGDSAVVRHPDRLPHARLRQEVASPQAAFVAGMDAEKIGHAAMLLGAGRDRMEAQVDPSVGILVHKKVGDRVERGEPLCTLLYNDPGKVPASLEQVLGAYHWDHQPAQPPALIKKILQ
ncbi:MAG: thymidine phosphorylase [Acidobacteria bacterium]|nr:thymidine phosphorylase [Acidobacteriota bacterium]